MRALKSGPSQRIEWRNAHAEKQDGRCAYCRRRLIADGRPALRPTLDHVVPLHRGGDDTFENTVAACLRCNLSKGHLTVAEFADACPELMRPARVEHLPTQGRTRGIPQAATPSSQDV